MRNTAKNNISLDKETLRENILKSMIASFKIENINITEKTAQEIFLRVLKKLKRAV